MASQAEAIALRLGPGDVAVLGKGVLHDVVPPVCAGGSRLTFVAFYYGTRGQVASVAKKAEASAVKQKT